MTNAEMRAAAKAALDAARAIHSKAEGENRAFTEAEDSAYKAHIVEHRSMEDRIRRDEELRAANPAALKVAHKETGDAFIGLTDKEARNFSMVRLMNALANPQDQRAQKAAAFEFECSAEAQSKTGRDGGELRGVTIPQDVLRSNVMAEGRRLGMSDAETRALTVGTATAGGNIVATNLLAGNFIEILRNRLSVMQAGATMLTDLVGFAAIPRQTGAASIAWVTEAAAPGSATQQAFDQVTLSPKTAAAFVDISRRLLLQSSMDVEAFVRGDLAATIALAIDSAALNGPGTGGSPKGILQTAGIGSVALGTNGANVIWDNIVDLETTVASLNADVATSAYLTNAKQRGRLKKSVQLSNTVGMPIWDGNEVNGYQAIASNQVPSNLTKGTASGICSAILFGNFADCFIGMWGGLDILVDPFTSSTTGSVRFVALQDVDVALRRLESFAAITDAL
jgi:HK97 family phage major capsid protein